MDSCHIQGRTTGKIVVRTLSSIRWRSNFASPIDLYMDTLPAPGYVLFGFLTPKRSMLTNQSPFLFVETSLAVKVILKVTLLTAENFKDTFPCTSGHLD